MKFTKTLGNREINHSLNLKKKKFGYAFPGKKDNSLRNFFSIGQRLQPFEMLYREVQLLLEKFRIEDIQRVSRKMNASLLEIKKVLSAQVAFYSISKSEDFSRQEYLISILNTENRYSKEENIHRLTKTDKCALEFNDHIQEHSSKGSVKLHQRVKQKPISHITLESSRVSATNVCHSAKHKELEIENLNREAMYLEPIGSIDGFQNRINQSIEKFYEKLIILKHDALILRAKYQLKNEPK